MSVEQFDINRPLDRDPTLEADILAINDLWRHITFGKEPQEPTLPPDPEQLQLFMSDYDYFITRDNQSRIIGAVGIFDCREGLAKIDSIAVTPEHRRRGHARTLAEAAIGYCQEKGKSQIITHAMPASQPLFRSLGFEDFEANTQGATTMFLDLQELQRD